MLDVSLLCFTSLEVDCREMYHVLTVDMLLLRAQDFFGSRLAHCSGQSLTRQGVSNCIQAIVYGLTSGSHVPLSVVGFAESL